jgi:putative glycosyltransferase (TIGR04348 family)
MLGYSTTVDSQYLAELLHGRSPGRSGGLSNVRRLSICIVSTTPSRSRKGNRITAARWSRLLRKLGHRVRIEERYGGRACDLMIALHARRSIASLEHFKRKYPGRPVVLALTGTDLYHDIRVDPAARRALAEATRLVVLQPLGLAALQARYRSKARAIVQSAEGPARRLRARRSRFEVCVMGHLRPVKDPFRAAEAARLLPPSSRIVVLQVGSALSPGMSGRAKIEQRANPRYRWLGELPRGRALRLMGRCRLLVLTSMMEGGANVVSEALAWRVPILSSRIPGSIGLLGNRYPGYFRAGDTSGLCRLLRRCEAEPRFLRRLERACAKLKPQVDPAREQAAWAKLLGELKQA